MNKFILEKKSDEFRKIHGIGSHDPIRLKSLLSQLNVITIYKPLSGEFSGMAIKIDDDNNSIRFILVNSNHSRGKQHFTICHELYHLFMQEGFNSMACNTGQFSRNSGQEYDADRFASYLLLPESGIKALIPYEEMGKDKISLKTLLKIEHFYSCSRAALLYRLKDLELISSFKYNEYCSEVILSAVKHGYSTDLYEPGNANQVVGDYGILARELFDKEKISETHYFTLLQDLGMNAAKLEKMFNGKE